LGNFANAEAKLTRFLAAVLFHVQKVLLQNWFLCQLVQTI